MHTSGTSPGHLARNRTWRGSSDRRCSRPAPARLKLPKRGKPYWIRIDRGLSLGYRRIETAGPWIIRKSTGTGGNWIKNFAIADDFEESNGEHVLTFWQAQDKARAVAHGRESDGGKPGTVAEAIVRYADNLKAEGGNVYNARMARIHLPPTILQKPVALLTGKELRHWRDSLLEGRARSSVNRIIVTLSSGLELAADLDPRITNRSAWKIGLKKLAGADVGRARNIVLPEPTVVRVVTLGYVQSPRVRPVH